MSAEVIVACGVPVAGVLVALGSILLGRRRLARMLLVGAVVWLLLIGVILVIAALSD